MFKGERIFKESSGCLILEECPAKKENNHDRLWYDRYDRLQLTEVLNSNKESLSTLLYKKKYFWRQRHQRRFRDRNTSIAKHVAKWDKSDITWYSDFLVGRDQTINTNISVWVMTCNSPFKQHQSKGLLPGLTQNHSFL